MSNLRHCLSKCIESALSIRENLDVQLKDVSIVRRTWTGDRVGEGHFTDSAELIRPKPAIRDLSHNIRLTEGGAIKSGDIIVEKISKSNYLSESMIDGRTDSDSCEVFYDLDGVLYTVISVVEHLYWWDVQIRRLSSQRKN